VLVLLVLWLLVLLLLLLLGLLQKRGLKKESEEEGAAHRVAKGRGGQWRRRVAIR
jgi:hypothetical protein